MTITLNPYINKKLGYYVCDNIEFGSKIQACLHSTEVDKPVQWVFNNDVFWRYNWSEEPQFSLEFHYNHRARQIRESYDYVILSYSGGSDSHNIYESFRRQKLHIDEILVNTMTKSSARYQNSSSAEAKDSLLSEHVQHTLPRLRDITLEMPKTKITVIDQTDYLFESLEKANDASWVLDKKEALNPAGATRYNYLHFNEVRKRFDKSYRIALIIGIEKPRTFIHQEKLYIRFTDRAANMVSIAEHLHEYPNSTVEFFYWSPDYVPLLIKQGHVIKRYLESNPEMQVHWDSKITTADQYRLMHEPLLRKLLYTTWQPKWFQAKKAVLDWYSELDQWFLDGYSDTKAYHVWKEGIRYVEDNLKMYTKKSETKFGRFDGLVPFHHHYCLGTVKNLHPSLRHS